MEGRLREFYVIGKQEFDELLLQQQDSAGDGVQDEQQQQPAGDDDDGEEKEKDDEEERAGEVAAARNTARKSAARVRASPPPYNASVDAVLSRKNLDTEQQLRTFLESLNKSAAVKYGGEQKRLIVNGVPTKRNASFYIKALTTTTATPELSASAFFETVQLAIALKNSRMPTNFIRNTAIINEIVVSNTPRHPDFGKWSART